MVALWGIFRRGSYGSGFSSLWENTEDFAEKFANLQKAALGLKAAAATGDKATIGEAVKATGGACKACHDEYKAKNYLY